MNKTISTQFFLQQDFGSGEKMVLATSKVKKNILDLYAIKCEQQPNSKYLVLREETLTEVIAESEDVRQSLLPLE
jgi:hypothetical protein